MTKKHDNDIQVDCELCQKNMWYDDGIDNYIANKHVCKKCDKEINEYEKRYYKND